MQSNNFNPFNGFGPMAGVANMQAPPMQQIQGGYPWSTNFQNAQNQRFDNTRPQMQQQSQSDFFVLVNGIEDVKNTLLQPNQSVWFRFQNDPYIAYKFANEVGTADTKYFEIREVDSGTINGSNKAQNEQIQQQQNFISYVQGIEQKVSMLERKINEIAEMKGVNEDVKSVKQIPQPNDVKSVSRKQQ